MHHAEFDRNEYPFEARYFHTAGEDSIEVPAGIAKIEVMKGFGRKPEQRTLHISAGQVSEVAVVLPARPWLDGAERRWVSADVHVHMNYGGTLPQYPLTSDSAGAGRGSRHRREPHRQQGAAHPRHRLQRPGC